MLSTYPFIKPNVPSRPFQHPTSRDQCFTRSGMTPPCCDVNKSSGQNQPDNNAHGLFIMCTSALEQNFTLSHCLGGSTAKLMAWNLFQGATTKIFSETGLRSRTSPKIPKNSDQISSPWYRSAGHVTWPPINKFDMSQPSAGKSIYCAIWRCRRPTGFLWGLC